MIQCNRPYHLPIDSECSALVGVLLRRYPKLSETFILGEILGLEKNQIPLHIFSLYMPSDEVSHPATEEVKADVTTLIRNDGRDKRRIVASHFRLIRLRPRRYLTCLIKALYRIEAGGTRDFIQAGLLASELMDRRIRHLHVHFISEPVAVAEIACQIAGIHFSISAHAKDIYLSRPEVLQRKLSKAAFTVTCTRYNWHYLQQQTSMPEKVHRMYHGLDLKPFDKALSVVSKSPSTVPPLIVSVGRLREKKGFPLLIAACRALRDQGVLFQCVIAGYGPDHAMLQAQIDKDALQNEVRLAGKLSHQAIIQLYTQASIFALPCRVAADGDRDGIPNVLLEAMAMHLPIVSTAVSGVPEVVQDGHNGLLIEADNTRELTQALQTLLRNPLLCRQLGEAGRVFVEHKFSTQKNLELLVRLLKDSLSSDAQIIKAYPALGGKVDVVR